MHIAAHPLWLKIIQDNNKNKKNADPLHTTIFLKRQQIDLCCFQFNLVLLRCDKSIIISLNIKL